MIKFFRHIRQSHIMKNQTGKYLKYAIGEIVLVVIGILIALQINNSSEYHKQAKLVKSYYENLHSDLEKDSTEFHFKINNARRNIAKLNIMAFY